MRHIISILLENQTGALSRVVGLFSQRGYNIETITAAPTEDNTITRITMTTNGDSAVIERIMKQLNKLVNVIKVTCLSDDDNGAVQKEILYVKLQAPNRTVREEIKFLCDIFNAQIVDVTPELFIVQYVESTEEIDRFLKALKEQAEIVETVRSGVCGIARGDHYLHT